MPRRINWKSLLRYIEQNVLRLYGLVSGMPEWRSSDGVRDVNVCADLDWKRAFAAHLWFLASPVASVADAFVAYEAAAGVSTAGEDNAGDGGGGSPYALSPRPEHDPQSAHYFDVKYHLLRLYTRYKFFFMNHSFPLSLVNTITCGA